MTNFRRRRPKEKALLRWGSPRRIQREAREDDVPVPANDAAKPKRKKRKKQYGIEVFGRLFGTESPGWSAVGWYATAKARDSALLATEKHERDWLAMLGRISHGCSQHHPCKFRKIDR